MLIRKFIPLVRDIQVVQVLQTVFIQRQLMNESGSDLEVWPPAIQEFEGFEEGPLILAHDVACEGARRPALPPNRVNKNWLGRLQSFLNEFKDGVGSLVFWVPRVQQNLQVQSQSTRLQASVPCPQNLPGYPGPARRRWGRRHRWAPSDSGSAYRHSWLYVWLCSPLQTLSPIDSNIKFKGSHYNLDEIQIKAGLTVEASSSPIKRPSLILIAPIISLSSMFWGMGIWMAGPPSINCYGCYWFGYYYFCIFRICCLRSHYRSMVKIIKKILAMRS